MPGKVWINGTIVEPAQAMINVYDHGLLYGDGVFEGIRAYAGKVFKLREHLVRLFESAHSIALTVPYPMDALARATEETVAASGKKEVYIRLVVTRGVGTLGIDPQKCGKSQVFIIVDDISLYPPEMYENGMEVVTAATVRNLSNALNPRIKSLNYLNNVLAKIEANRAGVPEAIMLNAHGEVCECTADNIFLVKNGVLSTPPRHAGILEGITRNTVMDLAREAGIPVAEPTIMRHDVYVADECFLTGTGAEIIPVVKADNRVIGTGKPGPITRQLRERYHALVRQG
jgi:branched-chain amino acid aminotransferase